MRSELQREQTSLEGKRVRVCLLENNMVTGTVLDTFVAGLYLETSASDGGWQGMYFIPYSSIILIQVLTPEYEARLAAAIAEDGA